MAMIQGIDGGVLLQALRAGRNDRMDDLKFQAKQAEAQREAEKQKQIGGLMGQLFPGSAPSGGGVQGQFASPAPQAQPASPTTFGEAFSPQAMAQETLPPVAAPTSPESALEPARAPQAQRRPDPNILAQLIALDPETGGKIASAFKTMDEAQLKQMEFKNSYMGAAARFIQQGRTPEERQQRFQIAAPQLLQAGFTPQELDGVDNDLSDERLQYYQATAIDYDKMVDNELAEREFMAGKTVAVPEGGSVANIRPVIGQDGGVTTTAEYVIAPAGVGGGPVADIPRVNTPSEAAKLPPGTQFYDPNGVLRTVPGGPTPQASGGF